MTRTESESTWASYSSFTVMVKEMRKGARILKRSDYFIPPKRRRLFEGGMNEGPAIIIQEHMDTWTTNKPISTRLTVITLKEITT